ncbi:hypothetical protein SASPL_120832 [Salvia splendens]|uniref:HMG box domain-containing protein n=1 Tax=Salvia splendens TaxID=180675 RepID=A0A8X8XRH6_SALSN|nr:hypothetical protein SASPL_120832 [Salvia splendens]
MEGSRAAGGRRSLQNPPPQSSGVAAEMVKIKTRSSSTSSASASRKIGLAGDTKKIARKKTAQKKEYRDANPDIKSMRDIGKACGEKWKTMTYEEKVKYYDIATKKRAEFDITMTNFTNKKESGEFDEDDSQLDDDSDFDG